MRYWQKEKGTASRVRSKTLVCCVSILLTVKLPVVNRFYAAASLRTVILIRHLQRILDALPAAQIPKTDNWTFADGYSMMGVFLYLLALPLLHFSTKSSVAAVQSVLHVLFLPTPFKLLSQTIRNQPKAKNNSLIDKSVTESSEVLKPGVTPRDADGKRNDKGKGKGKKLQTMDPPDDGELGDEVAARRV
ncbi:hypothetical protein EV359DRAFT_68500 [Lentinula novae-zelandiae]|nr:hypothetical protein EV359DRAFT_68500 [Lentinula novae-zelandiae]